MLKINHSHLINLILHYFKNLQVFAEYVGISYSYLKRVLDNECFFELSEVNKIKNALKISDSDVGKFFYEFS